MKNEWRDISGFPGYQVSSDGQVRSLDRVISRRGHQHRAKGKVLMPWKAGNMRYSTVYLCRDGKRIPSYVHQLVIKEFIGDRPDGLVVAHIDGDVSNNRASNLRWSTVKENIADQVTHGTKAVGNALPQSKLTPEMVAELRSMKMKRGDQTRIANELGVSVGVVSEAIARKTWKHL